MDINSPESLHFIVNFFKDKDAVIIIKDGSITVDKASTTVITSK